MAQNYSVGKVSVTNGSVDFTGSGTAWQLALIQGGIMFVVGHDSGWPIGEITSDTAGKFALPWTGATLSNVDYVIFRETAQAASAVMANDRLAEVAERLRTYTFVDFDESGTLANRAAYNTAAKNFVYLRTDVSPFEIYVKRSATSGDWAGPNSFGQGPIGPAGPGALLTGGTTTTLAPGQPATSTLTGTAPNYILDVGLPKGDKGDKGDKGNQGDQGDKGWSPVFAVADDGERRVRQLVDYVGGAGAKPTGDIGKYVGPSGYVTGITDATDERGAPGSLGTVTPFWTTRVQSDADAASARVGLAAGDGLSAASVSGAAAMNVGPDVGYVRTAGYSSPGDDGGALYKRAMSAPSHAGKFQSADGVWFEFSNREVHPAQVGVLASPNVAPSASYPEFGAGSGDQSAALQAWLSVPGYKKIGSGRKTYRLDSGLVIPPNDVNALKIELGNTVFDCSRFGTGGVKAIQAFATIGAKRPIGSNSLEGSDTVSLTAANRADLLPGMMVRIGSNKLFDAASTSAKIGELNWIKSVGSPVVLKLPLRDSYITSDSPFLEPVYDPMTGFELIGGEFWGPEATTNNTYGLTLEFMDNPKVIGQRFECFDYLGVAFQNCFRGEADITVNNTRPNATGYGVAYVDACLGGLARGTFKEVRHAASVNNRVSSDFGVPRDIQFEMHSINSAPAGSGAGGAAFDAHTAAENISYVNCISQGASGPSPNLECPTATVRNFKSIDSRSTVSAILIQNKSDRSGAYSLSGIQVDGSAGAGVRVQGGAVYKCAVDMVAFDIQRCTGHSIHLQDLSGGYVGDGVSRTSSGNRAVNGSSMDLITVGPYSAIGGTYSTFFAGTVTNSMIIKGADSSTSGVVIGTGAGNTQK